MAADVLLIPFRFRGPPQSGNGGYVGGAIAEHFDPAAAVEITLRAPIPLDTEMQIRGADPVRVTHGESLIAEACETELDLEIPVPPTWKDAAAAEPRSPSFMEGINPLVPGGVGFHPVCFCCGTENPEGIHVFAGPIAGREVVAAAWQTDSGWADASGNVPACLLWAALDCPGQFAFLADGIRTGMLGRITARIHRTLPAGDRAIVSGWRIGVERKKHFAGTAIHTPDGELVACASAIWIGRFEI